MGLSNRRTRRQSGLLNTVNHFASTMASQGNAFIGQGSLQNVLSLESHADGNTYANAYASAETALGAARQHVIESLSVGGYLPTMGGTVSLEDAEGNPVFTDAQLNAGALAAIAAEDPAAYASKALAAINEREGGYANENSDTTEFDYHNEAVSMEAYDATNIRNHLPFSVFFNTLAARQNEFCEAFFPTVTLTPDQIGVELSVSTTMVYNEVRHQHTGKPTDFGRVNLLDAIVDPTILAGEETRIYPIFQDTINNDMFATGIAKEEIELEGIKHETAPYKPGIEINIIGLSQAAILGMQGESDSSDSVAGGVRLQNIYLKITSAANKSSIIRYPLEGLPYTLFHSNQEGLDRGVQLNFRNDTLPLSAITEDVDGQPAEALDIFRQSAYANYAANMKINVSGNGNLEFGTFETNASVASVRSVVVRGADGIVRPADEQTDINAITNSITKIEYIGYDLKAYRSNLNRRQRGKLVENVEQREKYAVRLGSPVTAIIPPTDTRTSTDLVAPINTQRLRNDINGVTKLLAYADQLNALKVSYEKHLPRPQIEGIGRHLVIPFYDHIEVSMHDYIQNQRTQDKSADISQALVNLIREPLYRGIRDSRYEPALTALTGVVGSKPTVIIGTTPVLAKYLIVPGDTRLASIQYESKVVTTLDKRIGQPGTDVHEIFITLTRPNETLDPLSFGTFIWIPELATTLKATRDGSTSSEVMVQPRTLHLNQLPFLIRITVRDLGEAMLQKSTYVLEQ